MEDQEKYKTKRNLPTIKDVYDLNDENLFKQDALNQILSNPPKPDWIKQNKFANNSNYIPIGIIETLLLRIFKQYRVEILREGTAFNSVYVTIRLHYQDLITGGWSYHDGIGAVQLQTEKDASPAELNKIKNNSVMMAFPMAKSYALKDAAEHLGRLFGRDMNRKDVLEYESNLPNSIQRVNDSKELKRLKEHPASKSLNEASSVPELEKLRPYAIENNLMIIFDSRMNELTT